MRLRFLILMIVAAGVPASAGAQDKDDLARQAKQILTRNCYRCHGQNGAKEGGFSKVLDFPTLGGKVVPGDPARSRVVKVITREIMPPEDVKEPRPSKAELDVIEQWIKAGAPVPPPEAVKARVFVSLEDELAAMQKYLRKADREDRKYIRFFTLRYLHNLPPEKVQDADLRIYRAALSKLVNSLSRKTDVIIVPDKADPAETLFAVDLRKLDWDRKNLWQEVLKVYPYALTHDLLPDKRSSRDLAEEVYGLSGTKVPVVRADWFIATASRPPLYHLLLQLPDNAGDLERDLGINVTANFLRGNLSRAGFSASGVSDHNRLVERHDTHFGAYWKSYDFKRGIGRGNLFVFPLGPDFNGHPFPRNAFKHDGGEIIFNLPNGLQGYMLVDGKDRRIDEGPIKVVSDSKKIAGTPEVVNGLSCMSCHNQGMIGLKDQVRGKHILGGDAGDLVQRLFPKAAQMDKLLERDRKRFLSALDEAVAPFLKVGDDARRPVEEFPEPISAIARWYLLQELSVEEAAHELGLNDPKVLKAHVQANARLQELGLYPLAQGDRIKREVWEDISVSFSPFQEAARELKLGDPLRPR